MFDLNPYTTFESNYVTIISNKHMNISGRLMNTNAGKGALSTCQDEETGVISFVHTNQDLPLDMDKLKNNIKMQLP